MKAKAPIMISAAVSPAAREIARMSPVMMPGDRAREHVVPDRLPARRAERERAVADARRHLPDRLRDAMTVIGRIMRARVSAPAMMARGPEELTA